jgi:hypothetical protein
VLVSDARLLLERGTSTGSIPLPPDVVGLERAELSDGAELTLVLERSCPPARILRLGKASFDAVLAAGRASALLEQQATGEAIEALRQALALDPALDESRLLLARTLVNAGQEQEAIQVMAEGARARPVPFFLAVLNDAQLGELKQRVAAEAGLKEPTRRLLPGTEIPGPWLAWAPQRKLLASFDTESTLHLVSIKGEETFSLPLLEGRDFDALGEVRQDARDRIGQRLGRVSEFLEALGFVELTEGEWGEAGRDTRTSWVRFSKGHVTASGRDTVIRLSGGMAGTAKIQTTGLIGLDWGFLGSDPKVIALGWSRRMGSDHCPNGAGIQVFPANRR